MLASLTIAWYIWLVSIMCDRRLTPGLGHGRYGSCQAYWISHWFRTLCYVYIIANGIREPSWPDYWDSNRDIQGSRTHFEWAYLLYPPFCAGFQIPIVSTWPVFEVGKFHVHCGNCTCNWQVFLNKCFLVIQALSGSPCYSRLLDWSKVVEPTSPEENTNLAITVQGTSCAFVNSPNDTAFVGK